VQGALIKELQLDATSMEDASFVHDQPHGRPKGFDLLVSNIDDIMETGANPGGSGFRKRVGRELPLKRLKTAFPDGSPQIRF
jgi:hypothetical protein